MRKHYFYQLIVIFLSFYLFIITFASIFSLQQAQLKNLILLFAKQAMKPQNQMQPQQTKIQQKARNAYANLHTFHSKHYKLYREMLGGQMINKKQEIYTILDYQIVSLSHKRKKTNEKLICMEFLRDSKTVILGYDKSSERGDINFIDLSQPKINDFYYNKLQGGMGGLAVFKDGRYIIIADKKGTFTFIDMFQGPNIDDIKNRSIETPLQGVMDLSLSPAQNKVVLGMSDKKCLIIDIQTQRAQKVFPVCRTFQKHTFSINSLEWHPYKSLILSSSLDINDTLKLWDPHTCDLIQDSNFHKNSIITHCQFHPQGNTYFSIGKDNMILQYQLRYKGILNKYYTQAEPTALAVTNDGKVVVGDTMGHIVWFNQFGEVLKSEKGNSAVVKMKIEDSGSILVVARERQHVFQIMTKQGMYQLEDY